MALAPPRSYAWAMASGSKSSRIVITSYSIHYTKLYEDFIVSKYQILEALVYGADFILLIAAALSTKELKELLEYTRHLGMEALVEIHDKSELTKAIMAGADIIGINHRNLQTFEMNMRLSFDLIPRITSYNVCYTKLLRYLECHR